MNSGGVPRRDNIVILNFMCMCIGGRGRDGFRRSAKMGQRSDHEFSCVCVSEEGAEVNFGRVRRQGNVVIMNFHVYLLRLTVLNI